MSQANEHRARELLDRLVPFPDPPGDVQRIRRRQAKVIAEALDEAEARGAVKWRPASEPPDTVRRVFVVTTSGPFVGFYDKGFRGVEGRGWWASDGKTPLPTVKHWCEPPPEERRP